MHYKTDKLQDSSELSEGEVNNLKKQKFRLVMLRRTPLRIQGEITLVSCAGVTQGIQQLVGGSSSWCVN